MPSVRTSSSESWLWSFSKSSSCVRRTTKELLEVLTQVVVYYDRGAILFPVADLEVAARVVNPLTPCKIALQRGGACDEVTVDKAAWLAVKTSSVTEMSTAQLIGLRCSKTTSATRICTAKFAGLCCAKGMQRRLQWDSWDSSSLWDA
eukprot:1058834-Amphidinium_carterae.1